ncbi:MAG: molecular chaperone HscC, partial [Sandaracinus sp.]|nr:molecular chaperone HscC [Sandaracinus sp.]
LKFHPRESLPNRTALARADALFAELRGPAREELGFYLTRFRAALETQQSEVIDAAREQLVAVVAGLR